MSNNVLLFSGRFQYGVVDDFINGIKQAFERLGYHVFEVSLKDSSSDEELIAQLASIDLTKLKLLLSVNAMAVRLTDKLAQLANIPFYTYLVDHPIHLLPRFYGSKAKILCVDKEHVAFLSQLGINAQFWPHAVCETELATDSIPFSQKKGVLFPVSFIDENVHFSEIQKAAPNIASRLTNLEVRSISDVLRMLGFMQSGTSPSVQLNDQMLTFLRRCDLYLRGRDRNRLIKNCHLEGVPLTIIGSQWDQSSQYASHIYKPSVPFNELKDLITNSLFVLHHSPGFEQGQHERILYSLARGTCVLSSGTPYLLDTYSQNNGIFFYDSLVELKHISLAVTEMEYVSSINNAMSIIERRETWQSRVGAL